MHREAGLVFQRKTAPAHSDPEQLALLASCRPDLSGVGPRRIISTDSTGMCGHPEERELVRFTSFDQAASGSVNE